MKDEDTEAPPDLKIRTKEFALRVIRMYSALPHTTEAQVLGKQAARSGTSVGANYREAQRARSKAEFVAKLGDCLKELDETAYWFELLPDSGIVVPAKLASLVSECDQLLAIFTTIAKKAKSNPS
ncbi:MAG: four helix bundle protein [Kiritimatiellae bacterium]|nr:four helix bundle protein [Kiritimatiellia bacterium]